MGNKLVRILQISLWSIILMLVYSISIGFFEESQIFPQGTIGNKVLVFGWLWVVGVFVFYIRDLYYISVLSLGQRFIPKETFLEVQKSEITDFIKQLFNSQDYFNALTAHMPKGDKDNDHGLDYIPFLLESLREKKRNFRKISNTFLVLTIILAMIFTSILIYFGNVLINEDSVGLNRSFESLNNRASGLFTDITEFKKQENKVLTEYNSGRNINVLNEQINLLDSISESEGYPTLSDLSPVITETNSVFQLRDISDSLMILVAHWDSIYYKTPKKARDSLESVKIVNGIVRQIETGLEDFSWVSGSDATLTLLESQISDLSATIVELNPKIDTLNGENSKFATNELIKRLSIGLVVVSFFLAILKFAANLYRRNYSELVKAENDSLNIRKLYVAFKNVRDDKTRAIVLDALLSFERHTLDSDLFKSNAKIDFNKLIEQLLSVSKKSV